jgi:hypothetical protein
VIFGCLSCDLSGWVGAEIAQVTAQAFSKAVQGRLTLAWKVFPSEAHGAIPIAGLGRGCF